MENKRCFVQFLHPGGEHAPDKDNPTEKGWNTGAHARKFLCNRGDYLTALDAELQTDDLTFWGEWEPPSTVLRTIDTPVNEGPHWIYRPYFTPPPADTVVRNTDPFVFGGVFLYSNCQQRTRKRQTRAEKDAGISRVMIPTQMQSLDRGSVLLFGSCMKESRFVLDTVFVVDRWIDYDLLDYERTLREVPELFTDVTLATLKHEADVAIPEDVAKNGPRERPIVSHRLYFGATHRNPVHGMFSFVPCQPYTEGSRGFARPTICMTGLITDNHAQSRKSSFVADTSAMRRLWEDTSGQVIRQGLCLGVSATMPPSINNNDRRGAARKGGRQGC